MNKWTFKNILVILLITTTAFSTIKYLSELKLRHRLQDSLLKAQEEITALTQEKQNLLQELEKKKKLKDYLRASINKIARLFRDKSMTQANLEDTNAKFAVLKAENRQLKAKLNSIVELRKAIRELKARKRNTPASPDEGNLGFLIKDGQPTIPGKVKIEVLSAQN
ncbi:MAG: hypothetical protein PHC71_00245 [Candidatus Omnitrophica bacterium]|nr:hypothetical protein [Candidatus Omnitrophota bacterium]